MTKISVWLVLLLATNCLANDARIRLFQSGQEGYPRYRIPSLVVTKTGILLAVCEGRADGGGLTGNVDLVCKRSRDNGRTWTARTLVADGGADTFGNASMLVDRKTGVVWIAATLSPGADLESVITEGQSKQSTQVLVVSSDDEGQTWSKPRNITATVKLPSWTWYGCGPGVGIQLKSGRLFFGCYHAEGERGRITRSHAIFSDDHGKTWKLGDNAGVGNGEPQALQREDGSIYVSARTASGGPNVRSIINSKDGGATWGKKQFDKTLYDSYCQASLLKLPPTRGKPCWLYCHPAGPKRKNLTVRLSHDEGITWNSGSKLLSKKGQYSSMALLPNGRVGVFYDLWEDNNYQLYFMTFSPNELQ